MGRTYLDLCNECLDAMFYTTVSSFADLDTTEGRRIKTLLNNNLREICGGEHSIWKFRETYYDLYMIGNQQKYPMVDGYILFIRPSDNTNRIPLLLNQEWQYLPLTSTGTPVEYWIYEDSINLFPTPTDDMEGDIYKVRYLTNNYAIDADGLGKPIMDTDTDEPIIPEQYRSLLTYGTLKDFRANRTDGKSDFYKHKFSELYNSMLYSQTLTDDYIKGNNIETKRMTNLQAKLAAFYNPYIQGKMDNGG